MTKIGKARLKVHMYMYLFIILTLKGKKDLDASKRHLSMKGHLRNSKMQNYPRTH